MDYTAMCVHLRQTIEHAACVEHLADRLRAKEMPQHTTVLHKSVPVA